MWLLWEWGWVEGWELSKQIQSQDKLALPWSLILLSGESLFLCSECWRDAGFCFRDFPLAQTCLSPSGKTLFPSQVNVSAVYFFGPYFIIPSCHSSLWKQSFLWLKRKNSPGPLKFSSWHLVTYTDKVSKRKGRFWFVEVEFTEEKKKTATWI